MDAAVSSSRRLERFLAGLLQYGTWLASVATALGTALLLAEEYWNVQNPGLVSGTRVVTAGIALFILLPVARVLVMLAFFLRERDYRFVAIAALVLMIIFLGFGLGMSVPSHMQGAH
ncbi:DUF1634 domain-containing protein [Fimbriiglobus ruber]|uniref:DUF1634 domain-containing protein n=1 Tax=Fimbriiglobus ruber TaxID=1908690 RepID=A0A225DAB8_9BACT|nr:DUF1634 domain-containing protein [Fimbriiglobus ruber]OWK38501.1 hypothetical protein FRUB_07621 [Fimbriiglobus ruber]